VYPPPTPQKKKIHKPHEPSLPEFGKKPQGPSLWIFNLCASMNLVVKRNDFKSLASTKQEILLFITNVNGIIINDMTEKQIKFCTVFPFGVN
jgi:hypothetical protein